MDNSKINMHKRMAMGQKPTGMKKGGMKQGYRAREDESLGMRRGKESGKKQSMAARRNESYGKFGRRPNQKINKMMGGGMGGRTGDMMYSRGYGVGERSKRMPTMLQDRGAMKKGGEAKKKKENPMKEDRAKEGKKAQYRKMGFGKMMDKGEIKFAKGGSALKPVKPSQKGLKKLPTGVRNKMGYMKKGGRTNTRRMNRLEELGRVDAEKAYSKKGKRNLKSEKKRIVRELKK